jgi:branched-chain amino acid transport system ATP-binding protein
VMIEHDMGVVMDIAHAVHVLEFGRHLASGTAAKISRNPAVVRAYLGEETAA